MKHIQLAFSAAALLASTSLVAQVNLVRVDLDFEDDAFNAITFDRGDVVETQYQAAFGVTFSAELPNGTPWEAWIFDTSNPTGGSNNGIGKNDGDPDLATPTPSAPVSLGNILVVQETLKDGAIPDDRVGGQINVNWIDPIRPDEIGFLDVESNEKVKVTVIDSNGVSYVENDMALIKGANVYGLYQFADFSAFTDSFGNVIDDVVGMEIRFTGSAALTSLAFYQEIPTTVIPEPSTYATLLGLFLAGYLARRRFR